MSPTATAKVRAKYTGPERRANDRKDRPVLTAKERGGKDKAPTEGPLAGYAKTLDTWPANMLHPITRPIRYTNNPRINDPAVPDVLASLAAFGAQQTIVIDPADVIVVGDTRYLAALQLQWPKFPMQVFAGTEVEAKAYRIADNKTGERAEWDLPRLKVEFQELKALGFDLVATGFRDFELQPILAMGDFNPGSHGEHGNGDGSGAGMRQQVMFSPEQYAVVRRCGQTFYEGMNLAEWLTALCTEKLERGA